MTAAEQIDAASPCSAVAQMNTALAGLAEGGQRPPCGYDPDLWVSENVDDRQHAAALCGSCPLIFDCQALAEDLAPTWGVWAGIDHSPSRPKVDPTKGGRVTDVAVTRRAS